MKNIETLICKQLCTQNKPRRASVTCNGIWQDVTFQNSYIIQVSQERVIKTNLNILTLTRNNTVSFLTRPLLNRSMSETHQEEITEEPVLTISDDFGSIIQEESNIQLNLYEEIWGQIHLTHPSRAV